MIADDLLKAIPCLRSRRRKPSRKDIFNWINREGSFTLSDYNTVFDNLLSQDIIYDKCGKDSYYIRDNDDEFITANVTNIASSA